MTLLNVLAVSQIGTGVFAILFLLLISFVILALMIYYNTVDAKNKDTRIATVTKEMEELKSKFAIDKVEYEKTNKKLELTIQQYAKDNELVLSKTASKNKVLIEEARILRSNIEKLRSSQENIDVILEEKNNIIKDLKKQIPKKE